jgi:hypothetical protein
MHTLSADAARKEWAPRSPRAGLLHHGKKVRTMDQIERSNKQTQQVSLLYTTLLSEMHAVEIQRRSETNNETMRTLGICKTHNR